MTYIALIISQALAFIAFYLFIKAKKVGKKTFIALCFTLTVFSLFNLTIAIINKFTGNGLDVASLYHLTYGLQGSGAGEYSPYIVFWTFITIFSASLPFALFKRVRFDDKSPKKFKTSLALVLIAITLSFLSNRIVFDYVIGLFSKHPDLSFEELYKQPPLDIDFQNKNIVYLYLESFERTYLDENHFPGLTPELKKLEQQATTFTNIRQLDALSWTIAGMVGSQCGLPLLPPSTETPLAELGSIMNSATCLGDILKNNDYNLTFLGGARLEFAGKGNFYQSHNFDQILGYNHFLEQNPDLPENQWGIYDQFTLQYAWETFQQKSQAQTSFALFVLTLDTHHPYGLPSPICEQYPYQDGENSMLNSLHCSDTLASNFVNQILASPYAKDTLIVISSDHLAMPNETYDVLEQIEDQRRNLFMIIDPQNLKNTTIDTPGTTLDTGATLLSTFQENTPLGLGRSLLHSQSIFASEDHLTISYYFWKWSEQINELWQ